MKTRPNDEDAVWSAEEDDEKNDRMRSIYVDDLYLNSVSANRSQWYIKISVHMPIYLGNGIEWFNDSFPFPVHLYFFPDLISLTQWIIERGRVGR